VKRSRILYFHPDTNSGKLQVLESLHIEYTRYLQTCIDWIIQSHRMKFTRSEVYNLFPQELILSTNIISCIKYHAIEIVSGWTASLYEIRLKKYIKNLFRKGKITESQRIQLFTIGKYSVDRPSETISKESIDQYWNFLLDPNISGKTPIISNRIGMRMQIHTGYIRKLDRIKLTNWWLNLSTLNRGHKIRIPIVMNPYIKSPDEVVKGCLVRKDRYGRWRVEVLEKKVIEEPKLDLKAPRIGVDVGLNTMAATSDGRLCGISIKPKFDKLYEKIRTIRANRQRQGFKENSKKLDRLEDRLSGFVKTTIGTVANELVRDYPGHAFVIEDLNLNGCRGQKRFAYKALHHSLETKASVIKVNPAYTSQMCPSCGYVNRFNRSGTKFQCRSCGRVSHADVIGGINLLGRSEDKQINSCENTSEVKAILRERFLLRRNSSSGQLAVPALPACNRRLTTSVSLETGTASNSEGILS
jgi:transposase